MADLEFNADDSITETTVDSNGATTVTNYNSSDKVTSTSTTAADGSTTTEKTDKNGNVISSASTTKDGTTDITKTDANGNVISTTTITTNANGKKEGTTTDADGNVVSTTTFSTTNGVTTATTTDADGTTKSQTIKSTEDGAVIKSDSGIQVYGAQTGNVLTIAGDGKGSIQSSTGMTVEIGQDKWDDEKARFSYTTKDGTTMQFGDVLKANKGNLQWGGEDDDFHYTFSVDSEDGQTYQVDIHAPGDGSEIGKVEINGQTIVTGNINDYQLYNPNTGNSYSYTSDEDADSVQNTNTGVSLSIEHNCNGCEKTIGLSGQGNKGFTMSGMDTDTAQWAAEGDHEATLQNSKGTRNVHN